MYWTYLKYVVRHKWFVFLAGMRFNVPLHQLILHDLSKFGPYEFTQYARFFHGIKPTAEQLEEEGLSRSDYIKRYRSEDVVAGFRSAWNHHQKNNKHHWQYWVMFGDDGNPYGQCIPMPDRFIREMVADWCGAGMAISGKDDTQDWYKKNRHNIKLNPITRKRVHELLGIMAENEFLDDHGHTRSHAEAAGI